MNATDGIYDALVVGGGIAGATAAFYLAQAGLTTLLLEEKMGPHHKVCGEFLSNEALPYLQEMGIQLELLGASPLNYANLYSPHQSFKLKMPNLGYGISRYQLDEALLQQASAQGAKILRGYRAQSIESVGENFLIKTSQENFTTKALFLACGKHEISSFHHRKVKTHNLLGLKMHYRLSQSAQENLRNNVELYFFKGGYLGLSLVENDIANLCLVIDATLYQSHGNFENCLTYIKNQNHFFKNILDQAEACFEKPLAVAQLPYGYVKSNFKQKNIYFLGDQFGVIPSFSGSGMALALISAKAAVESFLKPSGFRAYPKQILQTLKPAMRLAYPIHLMSQSPMLADGMLKLLKCFPTLSQKIFQRTRIVYP